MITRTNLENYIKRSKEIRRLSSSIYSTSVNGFASVMQQNFQKIGKLAQENKGIHDDINRLLADDYELSNEDVDNLIYLSSNLNDPYSMENLDLMLEMKICQKLLKNVRRYNDVNKTIVELDRMVTASYALANMSKRIMAVNDLSRKFSSKGLEAGYELLSLLDKDKFKTINQDCKDVVLIQSRYMTALFENAYDGKLYKEQFKILQRSEKLIEDSFYNNDKSSYDWGYHMMRVYQYYSLLEEPHKIKYIDDEMKLVIKEKVKLLYDMFNNDNRFYQYIEKPELDIIYYRSLYCCGEMTREEYKDKMVEIYKMRGNTYDHNDIFPNLLAPYEYVSALDKNNITEKDKLMLENFYSGILSYIYNFKTAGSLSYMLEYLYFILESFIEIPGGVSFKKMCLECIASLHMPTYVHSIMVGRISTCICSYLLKENRELFSAFDGKSDDYILEFINNAGVMHDFGKLPIIDTIFIYGRKLDDDEFSMVKSHAEMSYYLLNMHESTKQYATIAYNHHMYYDGKSGYPVNKKEDKYKIITDIITIADCMDAATDMIGRSYNKGKTIVDFKEELINERGTRYNEKIVDLFNNEAMINDLTYLLNERRNETYKSSYITLKTLQEKAKII